MSLSKIMQNRYREIWFIQLLWTVMWLSWFWPDRRDLVLLIFAVSRRRHSQDPEIIPYHLMSFAGDGMGARDLFRGERVPSGWGSMAEVGLGQALWWAFRVWNWKS